MSMRTALRGIAAILALGVLAPPALADNMTVKNASGTTITVCTKTISTVENPCHIMEGQHPDTTYGAIQTDASGNLIINNAAAQAANQTAIQANAGSDATKAVAVQGVTGGKAVPVSVATLPALAAGSNAIGSITNTSFAATQSGTWNVTNVSGTVSLPTGASTSANQSTLITNTGSSADAAYTGTGTSLAGYLRAVADAAISSAAQAVKPQAQTTGGCTPYGYQSAASTNATLVSTGQHTLCSLTAINTTATVYYVRVYNTAAAPTCSSATGFLFSLPVPASASGAGAAPPLGPFGMDFPTGVSFCVTGGGGSTDNTNAATGVYVVASYK